MHIEKHTYIYIYIYTYPLVCADVQLLRSNYRQKKYHLEIVINGQNSSHSHVCKIPSPNLPQHDKNFWYNYIFRDKLSVFNVHAFGNGVPCIQWVNPLRAMPYKLQGANVELACSYTSWQSTGPAKHASSHTGVTNNPVTMTNSPLTAALSSVSWVLLGLPSGASIATVSSISMADYPAPHTTSQSGRYNRNPGSRQTGLSSQEGAISDWIRVPLPVNIMARSPEKTCLNLFSCFIQWTC